MVVNTVLRKLCAPLRVRVFTEGSIGGCVFGDAHVTREATGVHARACMSDSAQAAAAAGVR